MKVGVMLPVGEWGGRRLADWDELRELVLAAEAEGLDSVWLADHLLSGRGEEDPRAIHECWTLLAALAAVSEIVELGTLVVCTSFRSPGLLAKMAVEADLIAEGRLTLGLGAGWYDREYESFGYPADHKVARFAEAIEIVRRLLDGERLTYAGRYHSLRDAVLLPPPERRIPILVAAHRPRMMGLTARWADAWNTAWFEHPDDSLRDRLTDLDAALDEVGRPQSDVARTVGVLGADEPAAELAERLGAFAGLGFQHAIVLLDPPTPRSVETLAEAARLSRE